jgi:hypothetical protein
MRGLAWRDVLRAERVALDAMRIDERITVETTDVDCDGHDDVLLRTPSAMALIDRAHSAGLIELSIPALARNLVDTVTRQREPYHRQLEGAVPDEEEATDAGIPGTTPLRVHQPRPPGDADEDPTLTGFQPRLLEAAQSAELARSLVTDARPRVAFVEHLIGPEVQLEDLQRGTYAEMGRGLRETPWQLISAERFGDDTVRAILFQDGRIEDLGGEKSVRVQKRYTLHREPALDFRVEINNRGHEVLRARLALELDFAPALAGDQFLVAGQDRRPVRAPCDMGEVQELRLECPDMTVHLVSRKAARLWSYPIETVHQEYSRMVLGHQGVCVVLVWPVELWGQEKTRFDVRLAVETA